MKKLIKKTVLLTTIFSLCFGIRALAAYNTEYQCENNLATIVSAVNQGQYTLLTDEYDEQGLVHTNQWNEYQLMLSQGSPKVVCVWTNGSSSGYYGIIAYQLEGQQKVTLPENAVIKVTDKYNLDHLSILKYVGNQLGSSQLFNVNAALEKEKQEIKKSQAKAAAEIAKQQAEAKADQQQIDLNNQINAELNTKSENKQGQKTALPYPSDYINNYRFKELNKSNKEILASFDNERNYIQQWLDKHNLTLKQLRDMRYITENLDENVKKYGKQMVQADTYFKWIENGTLPKNCSYGDWIRYMLREGNMMQGWNWLAIWDDEGKSDVCVMIQNLGDNKGVFKGWTSLDDAYRINNEIYKMIEANLPTIAGYTHINKEQKISQVDSLITLFVDPYTPAYTKTRFPNYVGRTEFMKRLKNKFGTEYLPNIQGDLDISGLTEQQIEDYKLK